MDYDPILYLLSQGVETQPRGESDWSGYHYVQIPGATWRVDGTNWPEWVPFVGF